MFEKDGLEKTNATEAVPKLAVARRAIDGFFWNASTDCWISCFV
jgi:hypothetical protein